MHACCKARRMYTFMFMYVSVSVYMYMYACKHTHTHIYIYIYIHIHTYIFGTRARHIHTYIHTYITYIHTYIHTHIHAQLYLVGWVTGLGNQKCYNAHETYQQKQHSALLKVSVMTTGITKRRRSQELHVENSITETISRLQT